MEHPLIGNIQHLSIDELQEKISDLTKKLSWASRSGNRHLCDQLRMALESYTNQYQQKQQEILNQKSGTDYSDKIDIS